MGPVVLTPNPVLRRLLAPHTQRGTGETRKVSGTEMFWKTKEFGQALCKATFASSSPLSPATESGYPEDRSLKYRVILHRL